MANFHQNFSKDRVMDKKDEYFIWDTSAVERLEKLNVVTESEKAMKDILIATIENGNRTYEIAMLKKDIEIAKAEGFIEGLTRELKNRVMEDTDEAI